MASHFTSSPAAPALTALDTSAFTSKHSRPATAQQSHFGAAADTATTASAVQSPSLSSQSARARFEFEHGRGNEGTKVLMVEWEDDAVTRRIRGTWHVSWDGKPADVMPVEDSDVSASSDGDENQNGTIVASAVEDETYYSTTTTPATAHSDASAVGGSRGKAQTSHRLFFLLGSRINVPATVTLVLASDADSNSIVTAPKIEWKTNPLPAIFPKSLAENSGSWSSKGVLHGIWAQKRLAQLDKEIEEEAKSNCEGIALHMAICEKESIEADYGLSQHKSNTIPQDTTASRPLSLNTAPFDNKSVPNAASSPHSPLSPRSPGGSRIADKLKSLKLQTNEQTNEQTPSSKQQPRMVPILPSQSASFGAASSIGAILSDSSLAPSQQNPENLESENKLEADTEEEEQELFALPLSPRSPEMTKSPFSFAAADTRRYINVNSIAGS